MTKEHGKSNVVFEWCFDHGIDVGRHMTDESRTLIMHILVQKKTLGNNWGCLGRAIGSGSVYSRVSGSREHVSVMFYM